MVKTKNPKTLYGHETYLCPCSITSLHYPAMLACTYADILIHPVPQRQSAMQILTFKAPA